MNLALNNVFCAYLSGSTVLLGLVQGSYGIGGIVAPIAATAMVSIGISWARFYLITMSIQVVCFFFAGWSFPGYEKEPQAAFTSNLQQIASNQAENAGPTKLRMLGKALKNKTTLIGFLFIFAYQVVEVSESGWYISYLINDRHGDPVKVGYVASGFWARITAGRLTLVWLAQKVGEKRFIFATIVGTIIFQLMSWLPLARPNLSLRSDNLFGAATGQLAGYCYGVHLERGKQWRSCRAVLDRLDRLSVRHLGVASYLYCWFWPRLPGLHGSKRASICEMAGGSQYEAKHISYSRDVNVFLRATTAVSVPCS
ncbi:hypothetical protein AC578_6856 [Pseudocercospora eumusae]|uniref:Major facilitator superfamily (MFS) profile domain-containing protein n=1 Tax=Pseudocercospora eumusae TaxID=321146 RepID=A0A139H7H6_9PEZI|nr:hypothetical protein AC578_6856 [Pseudocercospora eumusae]